MQAPIARKSRPKAKLAVTKYYKDNKKKVAQWGRSIAKLNTAKHQELNALEHEMCIRDDDNVEGMK